METEKFIDQSVIFVFVAYKASVVKKKIIKIYKRFDFV